MKWEDPPNQVRRDPRARWLEDAAELRRHPGQWAVIREYPMKKRSQAYAFQGAIRSGRVKAFTPASEYDASSRRDDNVVKVYVRYIGQPTP